MNFIYSYYIDVKEDIHYDSLPQIFIAICLPLHCIDFTIRYDWLVHFQKKQIENKTVIIPLIMAGWTLYIFRYKTPSKTP
ncbi:hypothetical protein COM49_21360 [Bacillus pseudomycoides]|nr:hypothetical protein COO06_25165 [Bacillus pseudomycoides]PGD90691.1 hypothetical protein COM50_25025 [Bacillus pseudomycoides]PGE00240.1 hypothetical protein COM49_21360 [Bacillus pseudomycoides]PHE66181.1 hypothetical protein COF69_19880 [Bacillus pseudomycoides]PHG17480.1 hypothetical protein COI47_22710 [Bacillus pseudomycoides]